MTGMIIAVDLGADTTALTVAALLTDWRVFAVMIVFEVFTVCAVLRWCWRRLRGWHERRKSTRRKDRNP
jgi:hypothetical protein